MRIHEVLETCVEYVAMDGVLGSDPDDLIKHLRKSSPSVDAEYFAHIFTLLSSHPSIQIILTAHPLPPSEGSVLLGTAALPFDYNVQAATGVDVDQLYSQGVRGRELAYHLAGREFRSSKEAMEDIKKAKEEKAIKRRMKPDENGAGPSGLTPAGGEEEDGRDLITLVREDDGGVDDDKVLGSDYLGLRGKWGSRLRIRATDDEIHYRLVGSHQRNPKITPIVFHILQLAAKSRENGVTAIDLGPAVGTSQGSLHYFMKVLGQFGLCAKVPAVVHGALTNLLLFHRYLELNSNYRAMKRLPPLLSEGTGPTEVTIVNGGGVDVQLDDEGDDNEDQQDEDVGRAEPEWAFDFGPITEKELMAGHIVKERLVKLLENPGLKNHLLKRKNLLLLIGWQGAHVLRHRRAVSRHVDTLIHEGVVEALEVGERRIRCLRLTKYNPDYRPSHEQATAAEAAIEAIENEGTQILPDHELVAAHREAYAHHGTASATLLLEYQMNKVISDAGLAGLTMADVRTKLDYFFKRMVEFHFVRSEFIFIPHHLRTLRITTTMESHGRERRLRAFTVASFRELMLSQGQPPDDARHPPLSPEVGHWTPITSRSLYNSWAQLNKQLDNWAAGNDGAFNSKPSKAPRGRGPILSTGPLKAAMPKKLTQAASGPSGPPATVTVVQDDESDAESSIQPSRGFKYANKAQSRGRPRKYIHVVDEDGRINRNIIGEIYPVPELSPIYVYVKSLNKLVEAPPGYNGLGPPPPLSKEAIKNAHTPVWFEKFPKHDNGKGKAKGKGKKRKAKAEAEGPQDEAAAAAKKPKREKKEKADGAIDVEPVEPGGEGSESTRPTRWAAFRAKDTIRDPEEPEEIDELADDNSDIQEVLDGNKDPAFEEDVPKDPQTTEVPPAVVPSPGGIVSTENPILDATVTADAQISNAPSATATAVETKAPKVRGRKRKAASPTPLQAQEPVPSAAVDISGPEIVHSPKESIVKTKAKRVKGRKSSLPPPLVEKEPPPATVPAVPGESSQLEGTSEKEEDVPQQLEQPPAVTASVEDSTTATRSPLIRQPSPMIGEHFQPDLPIFDFPEEAQPKESGFVLPQSVHRIRKQKEGKSSSVSEAKDALPTGGPVFHASHGQPSTPAPIARPSVPHTQSSIVATPADTRSRVTDTPLVEVTPKNESSQAKPTPSGGRGTGRMELGQIRRLNELCQSLRDAGGVLTDYRLRNEHYDWSKRVAGTDAPYAPAIATQMDRLVFRRTVTTLLNEGRIKETNAMTPTVTGRWVQSKILYLPEISQDVLQGYIRELSSNMTAALTPKRIPRPQIAAAEYTEIRVTDSANSKSRLSTMNGTPRDRSAFPTPTKVYAESNVTPEVRRRALLKDASVVSFLYGYEGGRCARLSTLHRALIRAIHDSPDSPAIVSSSPRVFALPLLFTEVSVADWYKCVLSQGYDEDMERFLNDPETRDTRLKDVPAQIQPPRGFGSHNSRMKLKSLLATLSELKLVRPLVITNDTQEAVLMCRDNASGEHVGFKEAEHFGEATYFRVYEFAPVYHVAEDPSGLLGVLPVNDTEQLDHYWKVLQQACTRTNINSLPTIPHASPDPTLIAPLTDLLDLNMEHRKFLRSRGRWSPEMRLLDVQKAALNAVANQDTGESTVETEDQITAFAWEYALPRRTVIEQLELRKNQQQVAAQRKSLKERSQAAAKAQQAERRKKAEADLQQKIEEIRAAGKADWIARVNQAAERNGMVYSQELDAWLGRFAIQALSRRGPPTDAALDEGCRLFDRAKRFGDNALPGQTRSISIRKEPQVRKFRKDKKIRPPKEPRDPNVPQQRNRHNWSHEEDDMLLDCEAIIRARARDKLGNKGRHAMLQIFPKFKQQTLLNRLKKIWSMPGKQAYFDRLVDIWHQIWVEHRGTEALPDENPDSLTEFNLPAHLAFLKAKVPKQTLRLSASAGIQANKEKKVLDLPSDVKVLLDCHKWQYKPVTTPDFEAFWDPAGSNDIKSAALCLVPLTVERDLPMQDRQLGEYQLLTGRLKSALKMIVGTSQATYQEPAATKIVADFASADITRCTTELVEDKIIRRHKGTMDGRVYQFTGPWLQMTEGLHSDDLFLFAEQLPARFDKAPGNKIDWPLIGEHGEMAALMNMVSNDEVDFEFNVKDLPTIRYQRDGYNTRRLNDDDFEYGTTVVRTKKGEGRPIEAKPPSISERREPIRWDGYGEGDETTADEAKRVVDAVKAAGSPGLTRDDLEEILGLAADQVLQLLAQLCSQTTSSPPIFWAGYDVPRLVHVESWSAWTVTTCPPVRNAQGDIIGISDTESRQSLPRRWTDIYGERDEFVWDRSMKNVLGTIISRPGLTERALKNKLESIHDRLEIVELIQYILDTGVVRREPMRSGDKIPPVEATVREEEDRVAYWPDSRVLWH